MKDSKAEREKKLKHIKIYHQLYRLIEEGVYPAGSRLPSEPALAEQLNVSRMTLRRALSLLQEDRLVKNIRGKGNYICGPASDSQVYHVAELCHPLYGCCAQPFTSVELDFRIEPPSEAFSRSIGRNPAAVVIADRWYHREAGVSAYSLSLIPIDTISAYHIDLNLPEELKLFLESSVYRRAQTGSCTYSYTTTGNFTAVKYTLSPDPSFILIQETLFDDTHRPIVVNKHYIPAGQFELRQAHFSLDGQHGPQSYEQEHSIS